MSIDAATPLKARIRTDLAAAMKGRRKDEAKALRQLLAALDNAEAVPPRDETVSVTRHDFANGEAEVPRHTLNADDVRAVIARETEKHREAARTLTGLGRREDALAAETAAQLTGRYNLNIAALR